ncbi:MAG: hypothetical protein Q7K65_01485 [Candidatus Buchananbacteria bacterium]|nr:hypothetical protein [Candidatus Buchananbacteria bacterium]
MKWQKVVLAAFGLSILYYYAPMITLIAGAIMIAVFNRQEIKNLAGKSVSFAQILFLGFGIAIGTQAILTIVFGATFDSLVQAGGLFVALKNPAAIQAGVIKEVFALVIVFCATYLVVTALTPQRWVFKWAIVLSLVALVFQCFNVNAPLFAGSKGRHMMRLSALREEVLANIGSRMNGWGLHLNRDTFLNNHIADMPTAYFATQDAYLYLKDGDGVKRGEKVDLGSRWFHIVDGETIIDKATGISYESVASYNNETKRGFMRVDRMSKSSTIPKVVKKESPAPVPVEEAVEPVEATAVKTVMLSVPEELEMSRNTVTVKTGQWVPTGVATDFGDRVELAVPTKEDVERLSAQIDGGFISELRPKQTADGLWCAVLSFNAGGDNVSRHQIELQLKYGLPLNVAVQKL